MINRQIQVSASKYMTQITSMIQRWEWRQVKNSESGGAGATEGPQWGPGATSLVGVRGQTS